MFYRTCFISQSPFCILYRSHHIYIKCRINILFVVDNIMCFVSVLTETDQEPPQVFISYQWDSQDEVNSLRDRLEKAGYSCWMDIGQMGGGDQLYSRIDEGIRNSKVAVKFMFRGGYSASVT